MSFVISSIRSRGNGGRHTGFIAMDISFMGLSSAATRLELKAPHLRHLWMIAPAGIIRKYLKDQELLAEVRRLMKEGKVTHQLFCKEDFTLKRAIWYAKNQLNNYRKYKRYFGNKSLRD